MSTISSGTSEQDDNFNHQEPKASESQTDSNLDVELTGKVERLSEQINGFFNRISGIEKQLSTLSKNLKGFHDANLRNNAGSLDQIHSEIRNLQIHVNKIDKSINDAFGKIKTKKKEKKGKHKGKIKKK